MKKKCKSFAQVALKIRISMEDLQALASITWAVGDWETDPLEANSTDPFLLMSSVRASAPGPDVSEILEVAAKHASRHSIEDTSESPK